MRACICVAIAIFGANTSARADLLFPGESWPTTYSFSYVVERDGAKISERYTLYARRLTVEIEGDRSIARGRATETTVAVSAEGRDAFHALVARRESVRLPKRDDDRGTAQRIGVVFRIEGRPTWTLYGDLPAADATPATPAMLRDVQALRERLRADANVGPLVVAPALHDAAIAVVRPKSESELEIEIEVMFPASAIEQGPRTETPIGVGKLELFDAKGRLGLVEVGALDVVAWCDGERAVWTGRVARSALLRELRPRSALDGIAAFARVVRADLRTGADLRLPPRASGFMRGDANGDGVLDALLFIVESGTECARVMVRVPRGDGVVSCCASD
jgi:hypothetical protein